jgi:hypothetical protein
VVLTQTRSRRHVKYERVFNKQRPRSRYTRIYLTALPQTSKRHLSQSLRRLRKEMEVLSVIPWSSGCQCWSNEDEFTHPSDVTYSKTRPALGPTQPPVQWVTGALSLWVKRPGHEADHSPPSRAEIKNAWSYTSPPQYALMESCPVKKSQGQLYLYITYVEVKWWASRLYGSEIKAKSCPCA